MTLTIKAEKIYPDDASVVHWRGLSVSEPEEFDVFLRGPVLHRVTDSSFQEGFEQELLGMATTGMEIATVRRILDSAPPPLDWEIGEAVAECLLEDEFGACWPWNENRDRKTPRASLPGADIVGFIGESEETRFLFGEVKTSSDKCTPPNVLSGRGGLIHQIDTLCSSTKVHLSLLTYLAARCMGTSFEPKFRWAAQRFVRSEGMDVELVGILLRDTDPHPDDLRTRGQAFALRASPPRIRLDAWYAPRAISDWAKIAMASP